MSVKHITGLSSFSRLWAMVLVGLLFGLTLGKKCRALAHQQVSSIIMEADTGRVLYARRANVRAYPASLTKVMTLYLLFEALKARKIKPLTPFKASFYAAQAEPSRLGLKAGDVLSVEDAILAMVTRSANDVAVVIAENLAPSEKAFARLMTKKAYQIGMRHTYFRNASGLPHNQQMTTPKDMARLAACIRKDFPHYYPYFKTRSFIWKGEIILNHNHLLRQYKGTTGLKTGYTFKSGYNLIAIVERNKKALIGVILGAKSVHERDREMMRLFDRFLIMPIQIKKQTSKKRQMKIREVSLHKKTLGK